uniref:Uncharacterized protein n=1 Tax=Vespula pensylvanica TaxID=30213 RepID=A0A834UGC3_VESPE|nr:hypothetical protein H0235_000967 [Vespula pensylvanica]
MTLAVMQTRANCSYVDMPENSQYVTRCDIVDVGMNPTETTSFTMDSGRRFEASPFKRQSVNGKLDITRVVTLGTRCELNEEADLYVS